MTPTTSPTTTTSSTDTPTAVTRLIDAICAGEGIPEHIYAPDVTLDATVPNWRLTATGPTAVAAEYARWFADPATMEELEIDPVEGGVVIRYLLTWEEATGPRAAHHMHRISLDSTGRIHKDVVFCGGRWDAALLAQIAEANR